MDIDEQKELLVDRLQAIMDKADKGYYWNNQVMLDTEWVELDTLDKLVKVDNADKIIQIVENWLLINHLYHNTTLDTFVDNPDISIKIDNLDI